MAQHNIFALWYPFCSRCRLATAFIVFTFAISMWPNSKMLDTVLCILWTGIVVHIFFSRPMRLVNFYGVRSTHRENMNRDKTEKSERNTEMHDCVLFMFHLNISVFFLFVTHCVNLVEFQSILMVANTWNLWFCQLAANQTIGFCFGFTMRYSFFFLPLNANELANIWKCVLNNIFSPHNFHAMHIYFLPFHTWFHWLAWWMWC